MLYILIGFLIATIGLPLLDSISEIILSLFELPKAYLSIKIMKFNAKIHQIQDADEKVDTVAMGFQIPNSEDLDNEDDE